MSQHIDPVCQMTVGSDAPKLRHAGIDYYFCCPHCRKKFQADPAKYLQPAASSLLLPEA